MSVVSIIFYEGKIFLRQFQTTRCKLPELPSEGRGRTFESCRARQFSAYFQMVEQGAKFVCLRKFCRGSATEAAEACPSIETNARRFVRSSCPPRRTKADAFAGAEGICVRRLLSFLFGRRFVHGRFVFERRLFFDRGSLGRHRFGRRSGRAPLSRRCFIVSIELPHETPTLPRGNSTQS